MPLAALRNWLVHRRRDSRAVSADALPRDEYGEYNSPAAPPASDPPSDATEAPQADRPAALWTQARIAVEEELWGTGYLTPGGAPELLRFAAPIGLSAASSLLLVGAGAGGPPQTLATDLGVWVAGYEADPDLAGLARRRIQRAGAALAKRATVAAWNRHDPALPARIAHHALALDAIRDATPEPVLAAIAGAVKPHAHLVLVETVTPAPLDPADPAIAAWCRLEGRRPLLPEPEFDHPRPRPAGLRRARGRGHLRPPHAPRRTGLEAHGPPHGPRTPRRRPRRRGGGRGRDVDPPHPPDARRPDPPDALARHRRLQRNPSMIPPARSGVPGVPVSSTPGPPRPALRLPGRAGQTMVANP